MPSRRNSGLPPITETMGESTREEDGETKRRTSAGKFERQVIVCSNVLPVILERDAQGKWTATWDDQNLLEEGALYVQLNQAFTEEVRVVHVGVPNVYVPESSREEVSQILSGMNCYPVYLGRKRAHNHFQGYCKGVLFPLFHNILDIFNQGAGSAVELIEKRSDKSERLIDESSSTRTNRLKTHSSSDDSWITPQQYQTVVAEESWTDYCAVNRQFAATVVEAYKQGDVVWVHDYHLLLLPSFVRRYIPMANIGLYLHIPFPSSEIFRTLASREDIIKAMLSSDHIGFHLFEYARHFLTCCNRMLGLKYEAAKGGTLRVPYGTRTVMVTCSYVTPDSAKIRHILDSAELVEEARRLKGVSNSDSFKARNSNNGIPVGMKHIVAIDQVDSLRGISVKFVAFDKFLTMFPHLRNSVKLTQIGLRLDSRPMDFKQCNDEIQQLTQAINRKWGRKLIDYEVRDSISMRDRLALLQRGDVLLSTVFRQALCSVPFEYILARGFNPGVLLLSEFSACSRILTGPLRFNPMRLEDVAMAIEQAIVMSKPERIARRARDLPILERSSVKPWAKKVLKDIRNAQTKEEAVMTFGFGFGYRFKTSVTDTAQLNVGSVAAAYEASKQRLIMLDYSGTLVETTSIDVYLKSGGNARAWHYSDTQSEVRRPGGCLETRDPISDSVRSLLKELASNPLNMVAVVSNDLRDELAMALSGIPNLVLIAENGFVVRRNPPSKDQQLRRHNLAHNRSPLAYISDSEWQSVLDDTGAADWYGGGMDIEDVADTAWQSDVERTMAAYSERTNGAFIWKAPSAVSFNYVLADPEFGNLQSKNLVSELEKLLAGLPLIIEQGKGFVTVRLRGVNRGAMLRRFFAKTPDFDFILCCGDDTEDELGFKTVQEFAAASTHLINGAFTCRIGVGAQKAEFHLDEPADLHDVLRELVQLEHTRGPNGGMMKRSVSAGVLDYSGFVTKESMLAAADSRRFAQSRLQKEKREKREANTSSVNHIGRPLVPSATLPVPVSSFGAIKEQDVKDSKSGINEETAVSSVQPHALLKSKDPQKRSILSLVGLANTNNMQDLRTSHTRTELEQASSNFREVEIPHDEQSPRRTTPSRNEGKVVQDRRQPVSRNIPVEEHHGKPGGGEQQQVLPYAVACVSLAFAGYMWLSGRRKHK